MIFSSLLGYPIPKRQIEGNDDEALELKSLFFKSGGR